MDTFVRLLQRQSRTLSYRCVPSRALALGDDLRYLASVEGKSDADMGQQLSIKSDRTLGRILDEAQDPETGLALLAKYPGPAEQTPEQNLNCLFWHDQFTHWQNWLAGDMKAIWYALCSCTLSRRPPPTWLCKAVHKLCMPDPEKRECNDLANHVRRWEAVELVRGRLPNDPRNYKKKVHGDVVWAEAAKLVADTDAEALADTVRKSHQLIEHAGIKHADTMTITVQNYRRAVKTRDRPRRRK